MHATGTAEREAVLSFARSVPGYHRMTLGADKWYDTQTFVADFRWIKANPHVVQKKYSAIDGRTIQHVRYVTS